MLCGEFPEIKTASLETKGNSVGGGGLEVVPLLTRRRVLVAQVTLRLFQDSERAPGTRTTDTDSPPTNTSTNNNWLN